MNELSTIPHVEDVRSVGTRVSWPALLAGAALAFAIYFLLMILGSAVGLSLRNRVNAEPLQETALAWSLLTFCVALFVGGMMTSLFTVGENKTEAVVYGVVMWALVMGVLFIFAGVGLHTGFVSVGNRTDAREGANWETMARDAGVPADQIESWRQKTNASRTAADSPDHQKVETNLTRMAWYAFIGSWVSMLAAAIGAWLGAGPTFRIIAVRSGATHVVSR
jgi:hypothetical protein